MLMAANPTVPDELNGDAPCPSESDVVVQWPLSYRLNLPEGQAGEPSQPQWWHHYYYRNSQNQKTKVLYSSTKGASEENARLFLSETVLGFDMEWPWQSDSTRLQEKVGLIQIASESRIALFHIGLHLGTTTEDLIAPSLRKIIESPDIIKVGVGIINADFSRLVKHFGLEPKAALELSHLHSLVTYEGEQTKQVTTKLVALADQVKTHLGLPLWKGKARFSEWSKSLSPSQINYAADDAYCAFMLYHCMNAKRSIMDPVPPMPLLADEYADKDLPLLKTRVRALLLQPQEKGGAPTSVRDFFKQPCEDEVKQDPDVPVQEPAIELQLESIEPEKKSQARKRAPKIARADVRPLDDNEKKLFEMLKQRRMLLATTQCVPAFIVAHNSVLEDLARQRPLNKDELCQVNGIGPIRAEKYGEDWISVIAQFNADNKIQLPQPFQPKTPTSSPDRRARATIPQEQALQATPQLPTGLSFTMEHITIDPVELSKDSHDSDSSSAFGSPLTTPTRALPPSPLKRKRTPSPPRPLTPQLRPPPPPPTHSLPDQIFHNKLLAFSKAVAAKLDPRPTEPIVSEATIRLIVAQPPRTKRELWLIPGVQPFVRACAAAKYDLLGNIAAWMPGLPAGD